MNILCMKSIILPTYRAIVEGGSASIGRKLNIHSCIYGRFT